MNTAELVYSKVKNFSEADAQTVLDFIEFLHSKQQNRESQSQSKRELGELQGKASSVIGGDFAITDAELLR